MLFEGRQGDSAGWLGTANSCARGGADHGSTGFFPIVRYQASPPSSARAHAR